MIQREQMMLAQQNAINANQQQQVEGQVQGQTDLHKLQKAQQEMFIKSTLDYENRLRGHMYQFDESEGHNHAASGTVGESKSGQIQHPPQ